MSKCDQVIGGKYMVHLEGNSCVLGNIPLFKYKGVPVFYTVVSVLSKSIKVLCKILHSTCAHVQGTVYFVRGHFFFTRTTRLFREVRMYSSFLSLTGV